MPNNRYRCRTAQPRARKKTNVFLKIDTQQSKTEPMVFGTNRFVENIKTKDYQCAKESINAIKTRIVIDNQLHDKKHGTSQRKAVEILLHILSLQDHI